MSGGKKGPVAIGVLVLLIGGALLLRRSPEEPPVTNPGPKVDAVRKPSEPLPPIGGKPPPEGLREDLSTEYLRGYGDPATNPVEDLATVESLIDGFLYTVKAPDALPAGENREVVAALLGDNPYLIRFVDPEFPFINEKGELTDRWETPLFFHFVGSAEVGIRSAGPDRTMWTGDDLMTGEHGDLLKD